jgi:hypothetical protein
MLWRSKYYSNFIQNIFLTQLFAIFTANDIKVKLSLYRLWNPLELREVEAPTILDIWLTVNDIHIIIHYYPTRAYIILFPYIWIL